MPLPFILFVNPFVGKIRVDKNRDYLLAISPQNECILKLNKKGISYGFGPPAGMSLRERSNQTALFFDQSKDNDSLM